MNNGPMTLKELYRLLEDDNQHDLCAILVAVAVRDVEAVIRLAEIAKEHRRIGMMPHELGEERYKISQPLYEEVRETMGL